MIEFHDPEAETAVEILPYELKLKVEGSNRTRLALLANGFPDSAEFLAQLAEVLSERHPGVEIEQFNKGNASAAAPALMMDEIESSCQGLITAYGH